MNLIPNSIIRQIFALFIIVIIGLLIFTELLPYLSGVLGAITVYILMQGWMQKLLNKGWKAGWAAALLMLVSFVGILLPVMGIILMLGKRVGSAVQNSEKVLNAVDQNLNDLEAKVGFDFADNIDIGAISSYISDGLQNLAGGTFDVVLAVGLMYFLLYYMFTDRKMMNSGMSRIFPVSQQSFGVISDKLKAIVRSNALGIPLVAVAQGLIALVGFLIFGVEDPFFWFVIVTIGSMIPFVGTAVGILPVFILELSLGHTGQAWGILIYGMVVVGSTDNIVRLYVLQKLDDVHPLITLIGVIIGVPLFGFIGLIFGPLMISLFLILLQVYQEEYT